MVKRAPHRIARFDEFAMSEDGTMYAFRIVATDGASLDVELPASELGTMVQYLVSQSAALGRRAILEGVPRNGLNESVSPIPTEGFGMSATQSLDTMLLIVRLYTFELGFEIPSTKLAGFAENIQNTANLVAADISKKN